nr:MAG TPA: hypothetical protein [Caudoviricetes sp.]
MLKKIDDNNTMCIERKTTEENVKKRRSFLFLSERWWKIGKINIKTEKIR